MELIVEQITSSNKVLQLFKVSGETISIGRAYDNDIILQEDHISPHHARLSLNESNELVITDLESVNGIKDKSNKRVDVSAILNSGDKFVFGKLSLRILDASHEVAEAKKLNYLEVFTSKIDRWYWALAAAGLLYAHYIFQSYISSIAKVVWPTLILNNFYEVLAIVIVSLFVSALARVFKKEVKLFSIIALTMSLVLVQQLCAILGSFLWFNWGETWVLGFGSEVVNAILLFVFLWGAFYMASNMNFRRISLISCVLLIGFLGLSNIDYFDEDGVYLYPSYNATMLPLGLLIVEPVSVQDNVESSKRLFAKASQEAKRRNVEAEEAKISSM